MQEPIYEFLILDLRFWISERQQPVIGDPLLFTRYSLPTRFCSLSIAIIHMSFKIRSFCERVTAVKLTIILLAFVFVLGVRAETWSSIESEHFDVRFTRDEGAARNIQKIAEGFYQKVANDLGYSTGRKIIIWYCESQKEFNRSVNAPIQDWAAGCAYPLSARIVVRDPASLENKRINLSRLVKHEITHVVFGLYVGRNLKYVPRWFNEGLAMYEAEEWTYGQYWTMLTGSLSNSLIPFYELSEDFPRNESQAQMAYAQSCSIVTFMVKEYGSDSLKECVRLIAEGRRIDEALAGATGIDSFWFERKWLKDLKKRYKWVSLVTSWVVLWGFVVLVALLAYWRRRLKNRRIIRQWEEEEELWPEFEEEARSQSWTYRR